MDKERPGRYVISTPGTGTQVCPILKLVLCATPHCPHKSLSLTERQDPWVAAGGDTTREKAYKPISQPMRELRAPPYAELQRWKKRQQVSKSSKTLHTCSHTHTHTHTHTPHIKHHHLKHGLCQAPVWLREKLFTARSGLSRHRVIPGN